MSRNRKIVSDVKKVSGKFDILYLLAGTALDNPQGVIQDEIYPKVSQETLQKLFDHVGYSLQGLNNFYMRCK